MSTTTWMTADQLLQLPSGQFRYELIAGELKTMLLRGWRRGATLGRLHGILGQFVREHHLGRIFGAETGFRLKQDPDTVIAPDIAFIRKQNLPVDEPAEAYWPGAPELVVEVLSPSDRSREVERKVRMWLDAGAIVVWVVDPEQRLVTIQRRAADPVVLTEAEALEDQDLLPGFLCSVATIFNDA